MSNAISEARKLLEDLNIYVPFTIYEPGGLNEQSEVIAKITSASGFPMLRPHPESVSMLVGPRIAFRFFRDAPQIIHALINEVERLSVVEEIIADTASEVRSGGRSTGQRKGAQVVDVILDSDDPLGDPVPVEIIR